MSSPFPPAKLSANRAIGNWLAELCTSKTDEAIDNDAELECLAQHVAKEIAEAHATGRRVGAGAMREAAARYIETIVHGAARGLPTESAQPFTRVVAGAIRAISTEVDPRG